MTVRAAMPMAALEHDVTRAQRAARSHYARCPSGCCERCADYEEAAATAAQRLAAARSQIPERHIAIDAAHHRREERVRLAAHYDDTPGTWAA